MRGIEVHVNDCFVPLRAGLAMTATSMWLSAARSDEGGVDNGKDCFVPLSAGLAMAVQMSLVSS